MSPKIKPNLVFDHIAIVAKTLEQGFDYVRSELGIEMPSGGTHPLMGTHNMLLSLGEAEFLEIIAIDPDADAPNRPRWFDLDRFNGSPQIGTWILGTSDLATMLHDLHKPAMEMTRGDLKWQISVREDGSLPLDGALPTLIQWPTGMAHPAGKMRKRGCALQSLNITHPDADQVCSFLDGIFSDPRVTFTQGEFQFEAIFETPDGLKTLN